MSTRGSFGFRIDGRDLLAYNHSDSYPSGLGADFVAEVRELAKLPHNLRAAVRAIKLVGDTPPTAQDIVALKPYTDLSVSEQSTSDWYCLLRNAQGSLKAALESGYMLDRHTFIRDSLFCEYAYILNLDTGMVEFYEGFNKDRAAKGRYAALVSRNAKDDESEYCGCRLVAEFPMDAIPDDWEAQAYPQDDDE